MVHVYSERLDPLQLQIFGCGQLHFGISAESIKSIAEWQTPARLPNAPNAVLGVVGVRGHILTVLDPMILLGEAAPSARSSGSLVVLKGDEQLALAVDEVGKLIEVTSQDVQPASNHNSRLVAGHLGHHGKNVFILKEDELFATAIQGRERRRRRF